MNGQQAGTFLGTGCSTTLVHADLVEPQHLLAGEELTVRGAHGDKTVYRVAEVSVQINGAPGFVRAGVDPA